MTGLFLAIACAPAVVTPVPAPTAAASTAPAKPVPPPPPPPPLPPLPSSDTACPAGPLHAWSRLDGPSRVGTTISFPTRPGDGSPYDLLLSEPASDGDWIEVTPADRLPDGTPAAFAVRRDDVDLAPVARVALDAPAGSGLPRVELAPGARVRVLEAKDGRFHVATTGPLAADGWVDAAALGPTWRPCPYAAPRPNRALAAGAAPLALTDAPGGRRIAWLSERAELLAVASDAPPGTVRVVVVTGSTWADGYVREDQLVAR